MKKILLSASMLFLALAAQAQDCTAVTTLNEDFADFTIGTSWAGENCWNKIALGFAGGGGMIYTAQAGEPANQFINYYAATAVNVNSYLTTPEVSTFDGEHQLSFKAWKLGQNGSVPAGTVTIQVGTMATVTDAGTFVAFGQPFTVSTDAVQTYSNIVIPSAAAGSHIAFRLSADTAHNALAIDDVVWDEVPAPPCTAVTALNEDFTDFTIAISGAFPQNCWSTISGAFPAGPVVYTDEDDAPANQYVTFYTSTSENTDAYLITPEISNFDVSHALSFDAWRIVMGPGAPAGAVTIQIGTITDGAASFVPLTTGGSFSLTSATPATYSNISIPSAPAGSHIAFRISGDTEHNAAAIDNVIWTTTAGTQIAAKDSFTMFPNPTADKNVTLTFDANLGANLVSVYSLTGAKVFEAAVTEASSKNLNLSALSSGMYIVKVQAGNATATKKLVIE